MGKSTKTSAKGSIQKAVKLFFCGKESECFAALSKMADSELSPKDKSLLKKTLNLLLIGELFGLHTMSQILLANGLSSNNWSRLCSKVSYQDINKFVCSTLLRNLREKMLELSDKSDSTWSRNLVTIVFDDSIFKQWLSDEAAKVGQYFSSFFSGQFGKTVYGFQVTLIGVSIGDTFYPTHLELTPKGKKSKETACKLLRQLHGVIHQLAYAKKWDIPNLFVSADSGFDSPLFLQTCADLSKTLEIKPICVPKRSNFIEFDNFRGSINEFIKIYFCPIEAGHISEYREKGIETPPFTMRLPVTYMSKGQEVVLLFFRLNKSKKVSVHHRYEHKAKNFEAALVPKNFD